MEELGLYILGVDELFVEKIVARVLTERKALHLRASSTFEDVYVPPHTHHVCVRARTHTHTHSS